MSPKMSASYIGRLAFSPLPDGVLMELLEEFGFLDRYGSRWMVPKGTRVDGASIPQPLWSIIGSPFTGKYRDASVVHDYYCDVRLRPWGDVHRVFYEAMIVSGVSLARAKIMYSAVYFAGPRWSETVVHNSNLEKQFSILDTPFSRDVRNVVDVNGVTAADYLAKSDSIPPASSEIRLRIDEFEQLVDKYDPSISQISAALDSSLGLLGTMYPDQRALLGVSGLETLDDFDLDRP
jgi:Protein of unknown function (DUF1353)